VNSMTFENAHASYAARVIADDNLDTTVVALSYTDPDDPARNLLACIAPDLGSNLYRFRIGEHELIHCDCEKLKNRGHTGTFVLWPFPNRVRDKEYIYREQSYSLANVKREQGALIHGLVYDRSWSYEQPSAGPRGAAVTTFVEMHPGCLYYDSYPFTSRLALTYTLTCAGMTFTYTVHNKGSQALPYGFALHPYFNLLTSAEHTLVSVPAGHVMEADDELLPTGRLLDVHSVMYGMFELGQPTPVSHLKLDHVYTNLPASHTSLIDYEGLNLQIHISASEDFTHAVIFTPAQAPYFCLENQTCSTDAINLYQRGRQDIAHLLEVQPGDEASGFIRYAVEYTR
jgi:aldose 1-epimerase